MNAGQLYILTLGTNTDKYLCTYSSPAGFNLKRVRLPKTKIDGVRLPETIYITPSYKVIPEKINNKKRKLK